MNRFLALPSIAAVICGLLRGTGGVLGCTAMAGVISIGAVPAADAADRGEPEPRRSMPLICRHATNTGDRHTMHKCRRAWPAMQERSRRGSERDGEHPRRRDRHDRTYKPWRRYPPPRFEDLFRRRSKVRDVPGHTPGQPRARAPRTPSLKPSPTLAPEPTRASSPEPPRTRSAEPRRGAAA